MSRSLVRKPPAVTVAPGDPFAQLPGLPTDEWIVTEIRGGLYEVTRAGTMLDAAGNTSIDESLRLSVTVPHDIISFTHNRNKLQVGDRLQVETLQPANYPDRQAFRYAIIERVASAVMRLPDEPPAEQLAIEHKKPKRKRLKAGPP